MQQLSEVSVIECRLCYESYTVDGDHVPVNLPCGHTFGKRCLDKAFQTRPNCPIDNQFCSFPISQLPKNFSLIEQLIMMTTTTQQVPAAAVTEGDSHPHHQQESSTNSKNGGGSGGGLEDLQWRQKNNLKEEIRVLRSNRGEIFRNSQNIGSEIDELRAELSRLSRLLQAKETEQASSNTQVMVIDRTIKEKESVLSFIDRGGAVLDQHENNYHLIGGRVVSGQSQDSSSVVSIPPPPGGISPMMMMGPYGMIIGKETTSAFKRSPTFQPRIPCKHYLKGYCKLGASCNFKHDQQQLALEQQGGGGMISMGGGSVFEAYDQPSAFPSGDLIMMDRAGSFNNQQQIGGNDHGGAGGRDRGGSSFSSRRSMDSERDSSLIGSAAASVAAGFLNTNNQQQFPQQQQYQQQGGDYQQQQQHGIHSDSNHSRPRSFVRNDAGYYYGGGQSSSIDIANAQSQMAALNFA